MRVVSVDLLDISSLGLDAEEVVELRILGHGRCKRVLAVGDGEESSVDSEQTWPKQKSKAGLGTVYYKSHVAVRSH